MHARMKHLPALEGDQALAADPKAHAALSASAGTGKTQVLTARVLRLLLGGVAPEATLCLTFTKAAAAEMANRIGARLAAWVRLPDADLRKELFALDEPNDPLALQRARRLFARVLEAPGGLKIQTIHSFAQTLLASFPAEAGIAPGFKPIEARAQQELARTTLASLLADAGGESRLVADVQQLSLRLGEQGAVDYLMRCAARPEEMAAFGAPESIEPSLRAMLQLPGESVDDYLVTQCGDDWFDCDLLRAIALANRNWGTSTGAGHVEKIDRWLAMSPAERSATLPDLASVIFTGTGDLRKVSSGQIKADPAYDAHVDRLAVAIRDLSRIQNGAKLAADMAAGLRAGQDFAAAYTRAKRSAGLADFDDLIAWTRRLLATPGMGDWVRYKLDRDVDHLLIDEAQDTNPGQWEIVQALAAEFFTGASETERRHRTLFMVGDFKQAIYRFQGADPNEFDRVRRHFREASEALREAEGEGDGAEQRVLEFRDLSIDASFRSAPAILDVVDAVIDEVGADAMGLPDRPNPHRAHHSARAGTVELLKPFAVENAEENDEGEEGWIGQKERVYADRLAAEVKQWLADAPVLASTKRPLTPGDILILVRSRGELASLLVARLFAQDIPVAGIDRLHLSKPFAVRDLLAAMTFAVQPLDDLNLANLLVSPLIGWNQERLLDLAYDRKSSLWAQLRARAVADAELARAHDSLGELLRIADFTPPSLFLETILSGPLDGRRKLYSRLGLAARDPIDELMSSALQFERDEVPSLERFLAWFAGGDVEIQRDPSSPANAVRVMTVHGAKGLEAPVVVLADATADPARLGRTPVTLDFPIDGVGKAPLLRPSKKELMPPFDALIADEEERDLEEHWRLLYVGLTRASERLVIAGVEPRGRLADNSWHVRVERALTALGSEATEDSVWGRRVAYRGMVPPSPVASRAKRVALDHPAVPAWATAAASPETRPPRPLAPSAMTEDREAALPPTPAQRQAAGRGTLIHQLLERLPDVAPGQRLDMARRWLERFAGASDPGHRDEIAGLACGLIGRPGYVSLFGPGSLGEAPIAATLPDGRVIAGTVDRLLVEQDRVSVIDFKTGRVPAGDGDIPSSHRAQILAYAEALEVIFPGRAIRAALLYTGGPTLFEIQG
ncbi:MAG TPA: double-strand break repair helicase AddA [Sphingomicrobium sp.]|nr:double-strand break repair helicase AddA [Sphingomicrobium sp.]